MYLETTPPVVDTAANAKADDPRSRKLRSLQTAESLAMLSEPPLTPHSQRHSTDFAQLPHTTDETALSLQLSLRRGRLALLVGLVTVFLSLLTLLMRRGTELKRLDRREVSVSDQEKLVERYNSYSGTIASALGRPLEIVVVILVQVVVLWLMTDSVLATSTSWRVKLSALALSASVGFLLTNALNALNVQVLELPVRTVMSVSDLKVQHQSYAKNNVAISSTFDASFPENTPKNPTANTILRGLVLPRVALSSDCKRQQHTIAADVVAYGIPQQSWMKQLLPEAITPVATMKVDLLADTATAPTSENLPMNVSIAADLILAAVNSRHAYATFNGNLEAEINYFDRRSNYVNDSNSLSNIPWRFRAVPTTRLAGLLPLDESSTEAQDRAWFLDNFRDFIRKKNSTDWRNESLVRWEMEMSRVQLTPSVWVDAITFESEVIRMNLEQVLVNGSRYYPASEHYGSSPLLRQFEPDARAPDAQIHAFAVCADGDVDGISTKFDPVSDIVDMGGGFCANRSTNSIYVFSSGQVVVADTYLGNVDPQIYGQGRTIYSLPSVWKDVRVVYLSTFARVSWKLQNLSELYGADCTDAEGGCLGLDASLSGTDQKQRLLVGVTALPLGQIYPIPFNEEHADYHAQPFEIVSVRRPTDILSGNINEPGGGTTTYTRDWLGDVLLRHNIRDIEATDANDSRCNNAVDRRVRNYINNHLYIESTLQPTYTAAAFFLFQNGVVRDVLPQTMAASGGVALELDQNVHELSVWLSTPSVNANLTLAGCVVLVAVLCVMLVWSHFATDETNERFKHLAVTTPHQVARVMLDDTTFPSLLLKRRVVHDGHEGDASEFVIDKLSLQPVTTNTDKEGSVEV